MAKFNCLLLIFCLLQSSLIFADETNADIINQQTECAKNSAMEWNTKLNRCVLSQKNLDNRNDAAKCNELTDVKARENCHIKLAENKTGLSADTKNLNQGQTTQSLMINGLAAAYYVVGMINSKSKGGAESKCTSKNILGITALAGLGTDVYLKMKAKKKVKSLEDKYKLDTETAANEAQISALEYLKEEQQTVVEISALEKKRNMALVAGYGLAAGFAAYELSPWGQNPGCYESESTKAEKASKTETPQTATAEEAKPDTTTSPKVDDVPSSVTEQSKALAEGLNIDKLLQSPIGVITVAGLGAAFSMKLYSGASAQEKESKENIKKIDKILANFKDSYANLCTNGRDNLSEPKCYCYNADGTKNSNRSNSQTCTELWAKDDYNLDTQGTNYALGTFNADVVGCVTIDGQFDEKCQCKKYINSGGSNACKKETTINLPTELSTGGFATTTGLSDLLALSTKANVGTPGLEGLSEAKLNQNAINAKKFADQMLTKITSTNGSPQVVDEKNADKIAGALLGNRNLANAANSYSSALPMNIASSRTDNPKVEGLLKAAQEKAGVQIAAGTGKGLNNKTAANNKKLNFNFVGEGQSENRVLQGFPEEKKYNYKNSDIVTDNSASIFEIISNRYINSGLRRLFEEE